MPFQPKWLKRFFVFLGAQVKRRRTMRKLALSLVVINILVYLMMAASAVHHYVRGIPVRPSPPTLGLVIFFLVLLAMNFVILRYVAQRQPNEPEGKGYLMVRIFIGLGWFTVIYFASCVVIGGVVGAMAGASGGSDTYTAGYTTGREASHQFFSRYGGLVFLGSALIAGLGTAFGKLPLTKQEANTQPPKERGT